MEDNKKKGITVTEVVEAIEEIAPVSLQESWDNSGLLIGFEDSCVDRLDVYKRQVQIRARSGLAVRHGIGLTNGVGTIDSDYRGEVKVSLINWGEEVFTVNDGDRIAQMVVARYEKAQLVQAEELSETVRGEGGFGHTGI